MMAENAEAKTITVDDSGGENHTKIQDAVDNASDGDTIYVYEGTYKENVKIDRPIYLQGESNLNTTVNGLHQGHENLHLSLRSCRSRGPYQLSHFSRRPLTFL